MRRWKRWTPVLSVVVLSVAAVGWFFLPHGKAEQTADAPAGKARLGFAAPEATERASAVDTLPARVERRKNILRLTGTLVADERSAIASSASGIVLEVRVDKGSFVKKGDVLVRLDPIDAENRLAEGVALTEELKVRLGLDAVPEPFVPENQPEVRQTKSALDLAAANLRRAEELNQRRVISTEVFEQTRTEHDAALNRYRQSVLQVKQLYQSYKTAQSRLAILRKALADTTIVAPFDGWIAEKHTAPGEQVATNPQASKIVTLLRIDPLRLAVTVPQQYVSAVRAGEKIAFRADSFPDKTFVGVVRYIPPLLLTETRSLVVEAVVDNPDATLRPGIFVTAELELPGERAEVYAPLKAVQRQGEVGRVFIVDNGEVRERVVSLGSARGDHVEVKTGLSGGELLVAHPERVRDGELVSR